jgi:hypothetical protein
LSLERHPDQIPILHESRQIQACVFSLRNQTPGGLDRVLNPAAGGDLAQPGLLNGPGHVDDQRLRRWRGQELDSLTLRRASD